MHYLCIVPLSVQYVAFGPLCLAAPKGLPLVVVVFFFALHLWKLTTFVMFCLLLVFKRLCKEVKS